MSDIESKLKEENEFIKELFNSNGDEAQLQHLKEVIQNFIKQSKQTNFSNYLIGLLNFYSACRPHQQHFTKELVECIYSCFPEQINEIQQFIKSYNSEYNFLKFIIFPEEFPMNESKEQKEMFLLLQKDDIDGFLSFLSNNPTIDIT